MAGTASERLLLTVEEAARRLGIGRSLAWRLVRSGELPSVRWGGWSACRRGISRSGSTGAAGAANAEEVRPGGVPRYGHRRSV